LAVRGRLWVVLLDGAAVVSRAGDERSDGRYEQEDLQET
jgi:hypothetical protein